MGVSKLQGLWVTCNPHKFEIPALWFPYKPPVNPCKHLQCIVYTVYIGQDSTQNPSQEVFFMNKLVFTILLWSKCLYCLDVKIQVWIQLTLLYVTLIRLWACPRNTVYAEQDSTHNPSQAGSFVNTFVQWMGRKAMQHTKRILSTKKMLQNVPQCVNGPTIP